jgi:putative parapinopsin
MVPVAFGFMFLFGLFPMPFRGMSMLGFGSVVCGLYPGILLNNYYELYRLAKMSPEEVEEYRREHEAREAREEQYEEKTADVYVSLLFLMFFVIVGFFAVGIPAMHWKGYDPSPMIFPAVVVTVAGMAVSVLVKRVLEWKVPGWVYAVLLVVSVVGVLLVWGYPVVLLVAPWWVAFWMGEGWLGLVKDTIRRKLGNIPR